jgi:hypothetical protein
MKYTHVVTNKYWDCGFEQQPDILVQYLHLAFMATVHPRVPTYAKFCRIFGYCLRHRR